MRIGAGLVCLKSILNISHALRNSIPLPVVLCDSSEYGSAYIVLLGNSEVLRCCNEMPWKERLPQEESRTYYSGRCQMNVNGGLFRVCFTHQIYIGILFMGHSRDLNKCPLNRKEASICSCHFFQDLNGHLWNWSLFFSLFMCF